MLTGKELGSFVQRFTVAIAFALAVLIIGIMAITFNRQIKDQLNGWSLLPRPERLTELYFSNSNMLPTTYTPGQQQLVGFVAHDLEYQTTTYSYLIEQVNNTSGKEQKLAQGSIKLQQNASKTTKVPVVLADEGSSSSVRVTITFNGIAFGQNKTTPQSEYISYRLSKAKG